MKIEKKRYLSYRFMPMIILSYLFINLYFVMSGASWCKSQGCEISKSLLNIEQTELYTLAIGIFLFLLLVGINIIKKGSQTLEKVYNFGIFAVMLCETILLGYLYFKTGTLCISCFIFYILVIINFVMIGDISKVLVIPCMLIALALLNLDVSTSSNKSLESKYTLLQSSSCEHCKEVKEFLDSNKIQYKKEDYTLYSGLFSSLNITKIPLMLVKNNENNILILNGVSQIEEYIKNNEISVDTQTLDVITHDISFKEKQGCEIDFLKQGLENCKE